jgi:hypothetical protein
MLPQRSTFVLEPTVSARGFGWKRGCPTAVRYGDAIDGERLYQAFIDR